MVSVCFVVCTVACIAYWFFGAILGHWFETDWSQRQVRALFLILAFVLTVSFVLGVIPKLCTDSRLCDVEPDGPTSSWLLAAVLIHV